MAYLEKIFIPRSLKTTRNNCSSSHIGPIKKNFPENLIVFLCITNNEIVEKSKSKPKKFSFLCTCKPLLYPRNVEKL